MKLRVLPEAKADLASAKAWYAEKGERLSHALRLEVRAKLAELQEHPRLYSKIHGDVRQAPLRRFPYSIIYYEWDGHDMVVVLAVMHQSRDPEVWKRRVGDTDS